MEWIEPKTDWSRNDYVQRADYNRIIGNIEFLRHHFIQLGYVYSIKNIGSVEPYYVEGVGYMLREDILDVLNGIEDNVETTARNTFMRIGYRGRVEQHGNTPHWRYTDLNRIERNIQDFYNTLVSIQGSQFMLPLYLGVGLNADKVVI